MDECDTWLPTSMTSNSHSIIADDIDHLLVRTRAIWPDLRGASIFITGATGFFGIWLLEALLAANRTFSLGCRVKALSRDPSRFAAKASHLARDPALTFVEGDVRDFAFPSDPVTHVIHAATESSTTLNAEDPQTMFEVCVEGTRRALDLAREKRATKFVLTSSGAVYGRQPPEVSHIPEDFPFVPDRAGVHNAYAEGKREAEKLCLAASRSDAAGGSVPATIARCFAFVGPHLPLDAHFAIGNFIRDAIAGGPILVGGDGTPFRSYLYAADLVEWLLTILLRGQSGRAYNVGSEDAVSIRQLADRVAAVTATLCPERTPPKVTVAKQPRPGFPAERYVPDCGRARAELGLIPATSLDAAIRRTMQCLVDL
jgi:nucleoside-diphosphate-sugar epimerase